MLISKKFIPSLFTILNSFCGFMSIIYSSQGEIELASYFIIYAAFFDLFDGAVARILHSSSDFGVELDSLSDVISFGAAPSFLLYNVYFKNINSLGILLSSLFLIFSSIRLARFNVELTGHDKDRFSGLPTPIATLTLVSYLLFYHNKIFDIELSIKFITVISIVIPLLMVSKFPYPASPKIDKQIFRRHYLWVIIIGTGIVSLIISKGYSLFIIFLLYIFSGIIRSIISLFIKRERIKKKFMD
jgi:CDP-diacylglycerol--serine O-phosphatidyltransferase